MIKLETKTKTLGRAKTVSIANMALRWCRSNMGTNRRKKYDVAVTFYKSYEGDLDMGEYRYWDNEIIVYYNNCRTVSNLIRTIVHEWQHQLQPILTRYYKFDGTYRSNPYEKAARKAEKELTPVCWAHINKRLNKKTNEQSNYFH